jgi:FKBP-type peptidyl-prolyl cis-trans isomerase FkpA
MKKLLVIFLVVMTAVTGCAKKEMGCEPVSPQSEETQITAYASANGITAVRHASGMYNQITEPGTGVTPSSGSTVTATYTGKLLNGSTFDAGTASFPLSGVIEGWQIGLPLIKKGGKIKLLIPSSYAYGCNGMPRGGIPGNAVLFFDITLTDVR